MDTAMGELRRLEFSRLDATLWEKWSVLASSRADQASAALLGQEVGSMEMEEIGIALLCVHETCAAHEAIKRGGSPTELPAVLRK